MYITEWDYSKSTASGAKNLDLVKFYKHCCCIAQGKHKYKYKQCCVMGVGTD